MRMNSLEEAGRVEQTLDVRADNRGAAGVRTIRRGCSKREVCEPGEWKRRLGVQMDGDRSDQPSRLASRVLSGDQPVEPALDAAGEGEVGRGRWSGRARRSRTALIEPVGDVSNSIPSDTTRVRSTSSVPLVDPGEAVHAGAQCSPWRSVVVRITVVDCRRVERRLQQELIFAVARSRVRSKVRSW